MGVIILERERFAERASKTANAVFGSEWLGAHAANAVGVPAGMFSLVADPRMVLFVSGVSNLISMHKNCLSFLSL